jgi:hypothetical protein
MTERRCAESTMENVRGNGFLADGIEIAGSDAQ